MKYSETIIKLLPISLRNKLPHKIVVAEVDKRESQRLNRKYRRKDKPTNVLSFRYGSEYGEIIVCPVVIRKEAKEQGNTYKYQMTWMILHGILHLVGIHHEKSKKMAERIGGLERQILHKLFS
ncbi:MAG: putative rRNA maturation factor [Parcubacteria group bacterium GW2011_GWA2_45_30]|nr:MAG: putative rRNA maturation factor [Parcubacteria group bacterium GW2011_GWA2_45_30]